VINYSDVKDDLKQLENYVDQSNAKPPYMLLRDDFFRLLQLRVLHSIAADLDTLAFCARENLKRSAGKKKKR
jgi:hypothetical protein